MQLHQKELVDFARTVTFKIPHMVARIKLQTEQALGHEITDEENPYYLNMAGIRSPNSTPIYIQSYDTGEQIELTKVNLKVHKKTHQRYRLPNNLYNELIDIYPEQAEYIKCTIYDCGSLTDVITAPNYKILGCDTNLLNSREKEDLLLATQEYIDYTVRRWYVPKFNLETNYSLVFWCLFWQTLPYILLQRRVENTKTNKVHDYHLWNYLRGYGLEDYRSVLDQEQSHFLYQNLRYLENHKGSELNLKLLGKNLLKDDNITLVRKTIMEQRTDPLDTELFIPNVISESVELGPNNLLQQTLQPSENLHDFNERLSNLGLQEPFDENKHKENFEKLSVVDKTYIPTKFLELKKADSVSEYLPLIVKLLESNLLYRYSKGLLNYNIAFTDPTTETTFKFNLGEAYALMVYCSNMVSDSDITNIPTTHDCRLVARTSSLAYEDIVNKISVKGSPRDIRQYVNSKLIYDTFPIIPNKLYSGEAYVEMFIPYIDVLLYILVKYREVADLATHTAYRQLLSQLVFKQTVTFKLMDHVTYQDWFDSNPQLKYMIDYLNGNHHNWAKLFKVLFSSIYTLPTSFMNKYNMEDSTTENRYNKIKDLFSQMCSYGITFLDTTSNNFDNIYEPKISISERTSNTLSNISIIDQPSVDITGKLLTSDEIKYIENITISPTINDSQDRFSNGSKVNFVDKSVHSELSESTYQVNYQMDNIKHSFSVPVPMNISFEDV